MNVNEVVFCIINKAYAAKILLQIEEISFSFLLSLFKETAIFFIQFVYR